MEHHQSTVNVATVDPDISIYANRVVSNVLQLTKNLFCPYCADGFLFEFTLKDHLKKIHKNCIKLTLNKQQNNGDGENINIQTTQSDDQFHQLQNIQMIQHQQQQQHNCPYCGALFFHLGLIPKHITNYHGNNMLTLWQNQDGNFEKIENAKQYEPSIMYAKCSPGLSELFENIIDDDAGDNNCLSINGGNNAVGDDMNDAAVATTTTGNYNSSKNIKSILKNKICKNKIICSPSMASGRRTKNIEIVRSDSMVARRDLRFEINTKLSTSASSSSSTTSEALSMIIPYPSMNMASNKNKKKKNDTTTPSSSSSSPNKLKIFFRKLINHKNKRINKKEKLMSCNKSGSQNNNKFVTSTPINTLDCSKNSNNNSNNSSIRNRPLFLQSERFQCALCQRTWSNNAELLIHINQYHKGIRNWLRPHYRCGQCGATFYSNRFLVRHCHFHHTPKKY